MSSAFQGLLDPVTKRVKMGLTPPARYFRGLPLNAAGEVVVGAGPVTRFDQGIPFNAAGAVVALVATTATDYGPGATPYGPNGELEIDTASAISLYTQGVPYTAGGVMAATAAGGSGTIVSKDFTLTPAQVSVSTAGYRNSPLAGTLTPDNVYAGGTISVVLSDNTDMFYVTATGNVPFIGISGNLAVTLGVYQGPSRLVLPWSVANGRYEIQELGIYAYMVQQITHGMLFRLSGAPP